VKNRKLTVALISGGTSGEREVSRKGAAQVMAALDATRYHIVNYDPKTDLPKLAADSESIDVALVVLHGVNGEDGTVQGFLDLLGIAYQCTGVLGSAVAMNKLVSKFFYEKAGIAVPAYAGIRKNESVDARALIDRLGLPLVVKPASGGSSIGMTIVRSEEQFAGAIETAFRGDDALIVEEYLAGTEITGAVLGNDQLEALPLVEIVPRPGYEFFDYQAKYTPGETEEICPARISEALTEEAKRIALAAHRALFCSGCSRTDMIIRDGRIHVLETNTIPGMTQTSLLPLAARTAGLSYSQLLDRLIGLAAEKKKKAEIAAGTRTETECP